MQRVLDAVAWLDSIGSEAPYSRIQVAFVAGYGPTSGGFANILRNLGTAELIAYPGSGAVDVTDDGRATAVGPSTPPTRADLHRRVQEMIDAPIWRCLETLIGSSTQAR